MAVRARRFFGPVELTTSVALLYTVPVGRTAILRFVQVANQDAAAGVQVTLYVNGTGSADVDAHYFVPAGSTGPNKFVTLNPGDTLHGKKSAVTGPVTISAYGSLLGGAPE